MDRGMERHSVKHLAAYVRPHAHWSEGTAAVFGDNADRNAGDFRRSADVIVFDGSIVNGGKTSTLEIARRAHETGSYEEPVRNVMIRTGLFKNTSSLAKQVLLQLHTSHHLRFATMSSQQQQASSASTASSDPLFADRTKHYWNVRMQDKKVQATDGQSLPREVHMSAHKQRLMDFKKANPGVIQFGGPTYDDTTGRPNGSSFILRRHPDFFPERSDVEEWVEQDAYWKNQVWERRDIALFVGLTTPQKPA